MSRRAEPRREEASSVTEPFDFVGLDRFAGCRFEPYHIVAVADQDAGYRDGRASVRRQGTKMLIAAPIMHLPIHRGLQAAIAAKLALI